MSIPDHNYPKRWRWRGEWLCQTALEKLVGWLPGPLVFHLGELLGRLAWLCLPLRRKTVLRNLRIAFCGEHDLPTLRRMVLATFQRTGANLFSAARTARLAPAKLASVIHIENPELLEQALAGGKGVVLLLSHMGNWELLSRLVHLFPPGTRTGAFYRPLNNPLLDKATLLRRQADGTRMFSKRDSPHLVAGFLREGGMVGILADQRVGVPGEVVRFFGRLTRASPLPSLLARRAKSSVLALSLTTVAAGRWHARFVPMAAANTTNGCIATLEEAMQRGPLDVFWLQERWKVYIDEGFTIREWLGDQALASGKPHRALVWLVDAPPGWCLPEMWRQPQVIYEAVLEPGQALPAWLPQATRVHSAPRAAPRRTLRKLIAAMDLAAALPVDYLITGTAPEALVKACRSECIPLVSLTI
ncbi:MAG: hypothetical protein DVB25_07165 [Verrucomicrobia bacterium]|nr:MAG: hypothetical protein DVB25_07165 [Verrucomicrobiota bacterium]